MELIQRCTTNLQTFSSSAVTFATADNSIAATGIGTAFPTAGTQIAITGASETTNNITFTIVTSTANKIVVSETVTAESAGASVTINQYFVDEWKKINMWNYLSGAVNASQICTVYIDQSNDKTNIDYTTTLNVPTGVKRGYEIKCICNYGRQRILNGGTNQTSFRSFVNGTAR